jgi:hypothetical protein
MVASVHHPLLIPHGPYALVGNPNQPDGLQMKHINDLSPEEAAQVGLPRSRARREPRRAACGTWPVDAGWNAD